MRWHLVIFCLFLWACDTSAQSSQAKTIDALNNYVHFSNESIHGLLIAHRLFENYNQEINKYVDLDGYQLNYYSNTDLPSNIFVDPDQWFYEISPYSWFDRSIDQSAHLPQRIRAPLNRMIRAQKDILDAINGKRVEIADYIAAHDLTDTVQLRGVYDRLEACVVLYDTFFANHIQLETNLQQGFEAVGGYAGAHGDLYARMTDIHGSAQAILRALRSKEDRSFQSKIDAFGKYYSRLSLGAWTKDESPALTSSEFRRRQHDAQQKFGDIHRQATVFIQEASVPIEYKLYGKFYYYHNSDIINKMNRYGNGYVFEINQVFTLLNMPVLYLLEEPHYYRVIYPKKLVPHDVIVSTDDKVEQLPEQLKDREVISGSRKIVVDSMTFQVELFDHMIQDGDIVSINFNGDWILENHSLEAKAKKLRIKLNDNGKNYLLLHAENVGKRPPNTMGVAYFYRGEKKEITLKSDLNASEMIEIEYDPPSDSF